MHRIDAAGNVAGQFTEGNPQEGQLATRVSAAWLNDIQGNLAHVIEMAEIALVKGDFAQLYLAIVAIANGAVGEAAGGAVPTDRQVNTAGIATGGGTLATNLTINVPKASGAEVAAGTDDAKAVTAAAIVAAMASVKTATGYTKLFNGLILQWGQSNVSANSTTVITLPTTFPNACLFAGSSGGSADAGAQDNDPYVSGKGTGSISVFSARDSTVSMNWWAFGH